MSNVRSHMSMRHALGCCVVMLLAVGKVGAATSEVADAAMKGTREPVGALLQRKADANVPQVEGTTALHRAARADGMEMHVILLRQVSVCHGEYRYADASSMG